MNFLLLAAKALSHGAICGRPSIIATATAFGKEGIARIKHPTDSSSSNPMSVGDERQAASVREEAQPAVTLHPPVDDGHETNWYFEPWALLGDQT